MQQLSVSSLLRYLKNRLDTDERLQKIYVSGEISNFHRHFSGHLYFTLKDEYASISCVMFKSAASSLRFEPKTGDKVVVYANTSIFETAGQLQLYVQRMTTEGLGDLYARYEALKNKLNEEGYFAAQHKISMKKKYPERIAVLVGDKSAAMSDIRRCFERRWPFCRVDYYPVLVQGTEAAADIIEKLHEADEKNYDAIILARGGGSFEDLFCFNDERLVKTIYAMDTFLVTGIGHEQDFTLADFVADLRSATPTAAVELITPDIKDVGKQLDLFQKQMDISITQLLDRRKMSFDYYSQKLIHYIDSLSVIRDRIDAQVEMIRNSILHRCDMNSSLIDHYNAQIASDMNLRLSNAKLHCKRLNTLLEAYSAQNVLERGYSIVMQNGKVIKRKSEIAHDSFDIRFYDGILTATEKE